MLHGIVCETTPTDGREKGTDLPKPRKDCAEHTILLAAQSRLRGSSTPAAVLIRRQIALSLSLLPLQGLIQVAGAIKQTCGHARDSA